MAERRNVDLPLRYVTGRLRAFRRESRRGFNLVLLTMIVTVLTVMIAAVLPVWSGVIARDKEAELIFRGLQYAEGIRVFQQRFGRLPVRLEELMEVRPRCIRQKWKNPMTEDGHWGLVVQTGPGGTPNPGGQPGPGGTVGLDTSKGDVRGPIRGVYSPDGGESFRTFFGSSTIKDWKFTVEQLLPPKVGGDPSTPVAAVINADNIGRPFPPGVGLVPVSLGPGAIP
ncbi:MAG: hypothetical protein HC897_12285, partial [Thermoanaerobaculia bacterium]|nr:hypothetical protein [Thermoanaerobaculia bacterium]